jgi:hypothetical protein
MPSKADIDAERREPEPGLDYGWVLEVIKNDIVTGFQLQTVSDHIDRLA